MNKTTFELEKPFTCLKHKYTVLNSNEDNCFEVHNLTNGKLYIVNPFMGICDCKDFEFRTNGGTCKHIEFLRESKLLKPLIKIWKEQHHDTPKLTRNNPILAVGEPDGQGEQFPYTIMERKDENQILAELKGNVIEEFVYSFQ